MAKYIDKSYLIDNLKSFKNIVLDENYLASKTTTANAGKAVVVDTDGSLKFDEAGVQVSKETGNQIETKADGIYVASEINDTGASTVGTYSSNKIVNDFVAKEEGKSLVSTSDIAQITTNKNDIVTLNADDTTTGSVAKQIKDAIAGVTQFDYEVVTALPATGVKGKIYLVANSGSGQNIYDEYIWVGDKFEMLGTTEMDLSNYVQKEDGKGLISTAEITRLASVDNYDDTALSNRVSTIEGKEAGWDAKVDAVSGKGLSTNDYTTDEKNKLAGIATGATANTGTITGITMNGSSKGTSGVVDLGTVITEHQDISGKADTSALGTQVTYVLNGTSLTITTK